MAPERYCYAFEEGDGKNKHLLGGKGAGLCSMTQIGLPVPPGFVITTKANVDYLESGGHFPEGLMDEVHEYLEALEKKTGKGFGNPENPLLVSVRSGSALSMPGMMDTILNLGFNDETVKGFINLTQNDRFVYDAYRRFLQLFGKIGWASRMSISTKFLTRSKKNIMPVWTRNLTPKPWPKSAIGSRT